MYNGQGRSDLRANRGSRGRGFGTVRLHLTLGVLLTGCADVAPEAAVIRTDSAGVAIVEYRALGEAPAEWTVQLDGAVDLTVSPEDVGLYRVRGAVRLPGGGTAVADAGNMRVVIFGPDGQMRSIQGREGEGPGEYLDIALLARWGTDSLAVWDRRLRRLNVLDGSGTYVRSLSLQSTETVPYASVMGIYSNRSLLAQGGVALEGEITTGRHTFSAPLYEFTPDGEVGTELGLHPVGESYYKALDGGFSVWPALFMTTSVRLAVGDRLLLGTSEAYELRFHDPSGKLLQFVRRSGALPPVDGEARMAEEAAILAPMTEESAERTRAVLADMDIPATLPAFRDVIGDRAGNTWVEEFEPGRPETRVWAVYAPDGSQVAVGRTPQGLQLMDVGEDYAIGVITDEFGVEKVVSAVLVRTEAGG